MPCWTLVEFAMAPEPFTRAGARISPKAIVTAMEMCWTPAGFAEEPGRTSMQTGYATTLTTVLMLNQSTFRMKGT